MKGAVGEMMTDDEENDGLDSSSSPPNRCLESQPVPTKLSVLQCIMLSRPGKDNPAEVRTQQPGPKSSCGL